MSLFEGLKDGNSDDDIKLIASGKVASGFGLVKTLAVSRSICRSVADLTMWGFARISLNLLVGVVSEGVKIEKHWGFVCVVS